MSPTASTVKPRLAALTALLGTAILVAGCTSDDSTDAGPVVTTVLTETASPGGTDTTEAPAASGESGDSAGQATVVTTVVAVGRDGEARDGWTVDTSAVAGELNCDPMMSARSAVSDDIYACSPSAAGAHTCWPGSASSVALLCGNTPWDKVLRPMTSNVPLEPVTKPADPWPWALETVDGVRCTMRNGGAWGNRSDGLVGAYGCADSQDVVLVEPSEGAEAVDTSAKQWTVRMGPLGVDDAVFPPPTTVGVKQAWFAGTQ